MATSLSQLSACVTRILSLTGFPKELKTKDIQAAYSEWETANGGFKIKWINDTSLLIVFNDATVGEHFASSYPPHLCPQFRSPPTCCVPHLISRVVHVLACLSLTTILHINTRSHSSSLFNPIAKRAYLHSLAFPPPIFTSPNTSASAIVKPYDGPDAQSVIQNVNARQHNSNGRGHNIRNSVSHARGVSVSTSLRNNPNNTASSSSNALNNNANQNNPASLITSSLNGNPNSSDRNQSSPTLPNIPSHPTLNALISSSLGPEVVAPTDHAHAFQDPAILAAQPEHGAPRIGDPGKRMLGAALGVRHPGLGPRVINGGAGNTGAGPMDVRGPMGGLIVAE